MWLTIPSAAEGLDETGLPAEAYVPGQAGGAGGAPATTGGATGLGVGTAPAAAFPGSGQPVGAAPASTPGSSNKMVFDSGSSHKA